METNAKPETETPKMENQITQQTPAELRGAALAQRDHWEAQALADAIVTESDAGLAAWHRALFDRVMEAIPHLNASTWVELTSRSEAVAILGEISREIDSRKTAMNRRKKKEVLKAARKAGL